MALGTAVFNVVQFFHLQSDRLMNYGELKRLLITNPTSSLQFVLPNGEVIPVNFHLTEVGRVEKTFIDCGGTQRVAVTCQLQLWTANDHEHRLLSGKLLKVLESAEPVLQSDELPIEVEYGQSVASIYTIGDVVAAFGNLQFSLLGKQTDCLAKDKCNIVGCNDTQTCC